MASYGCTDDVSGAYGVGDYGTCTVQSVGAPNTGIFQGLMSSGSLIIIAPLVLIIVLASITTLIIGIKNRKAKKSTPAEMPQRGQDTDKVK